MHSQRENTLHSALVGYEHTWRRVYTRLCILELIAPLRNGINYQCKLSAVNDVFVTHNKAIYILLLVRHFIEYRFFSSCVVVVAVAVVVCCLFFVRIAFSSTFHSTKFDRKTIGNIASNERRNKNKKNCSTLKSEPKTGWRQSKTHWKLQHYR